jgi:glc operon protein GlcG
VRQLSVSLVQAKRVLAAAERRARQLGVPMFIVVVDDCGVIKAAERMDGNSQASVALVPPKAVTANAFRTPTATLAQGVAGDPTRLGSFLGAGFSLLGGGVPLVVDGTVIGAVGAGGGSPTQDAELAQAGADALR